jgi:hypothetical protein
MGFSLPKFNFFFYFKASQEKKSKQSATKPQKGLNYREHIACVWFYTLPVFRIRLDPHSIWARIRIRILDPDV